MGDANIAGRLRLRIGHILLLPSCSFRQTHFLSLDLGTYVLA